MSSSRRLLLVGGGHAHAEVLRRFALRPPPQVEITLVVDRPNAVYSGMVPGFVAGTYDLAEITLDLEGLARRAGAEVIEATVVDVQPAPPSLTLADGRVLGYDVLSLNVGSSVRGLELPGVRRHALATRPIGAFVEDLERRVDEVRARSPGRPPRICVAGAGAAGVELAFALRSRLGTRAQLGLVDGKATLMAGHARRLQAFVAQELERAGIRSYLGRDVLGVEEHALAVVGARIDCDLAIWAAGAAPPALLATVPLPRDDRGYLCVRTTLQAVAHDTIFGAGDCVTLVENAWVPKAGVYAVRQGPVLAENLRRFLAGKPLQTYRPQARFLSLLNLGNGRAIASRGGRWAVRGAAVWALKDWIDRRFVARYGAPRAN